MSEIPAPLGFCTDCLADRKQEVIATTIFDGSAVCRSCNEDLQQIKDQQAADAEETLRELAAKRRSIEELYPPR